MRKPKKIPRSLDKYKVPQKTLQPEKPEPQKPPAAEAKPKPVKQQAKPKPAKSETTPPKMDTNSDVKKVIGPIIYIEAGLAETVEAIRQNNGYGDAEIEFVLSERVRKFLSSGEIGDQLIAQSSNDIKLYKAKKASAVLSFRFRTQITQADMDHLRSKLKDPLGMIPDASVLATALETIFVEELAKI